MTPTDILAYAALLGLFGVLWLAAYLWVLPLTRPNPHQGEGERGSAAAPATVTPLPAGTLIEIGDAAFTPEEASKIVSLADWYAGKRVNVSWRGNGDGGGAA